MKEQLCPQFSCSYNIFSESRKCAKHQTNINLRGQRKASTVNLRKLFKSSTKSSGVSKMISTYLLY